MYVTIPPSRAVLHIRFQKAPRALEDAIDLGRRERAHPPEGMNAARKQHLALVDISQPRHHSLVQQDVRDLLIAMRQQARLRFVRRELRAQQIRA